MKEDNLYDILGKGKNMEKVKKISGFQELEEREEWLAGVYGIFKTMKLPCMILQYRYMSLYICQTP